jgi:hypothetical protein
VHAALRDHFAGEMRELLDQPDILQQGGTARPRGLNVKLSVTGVPDAWANGGRLDCSFMGAPVERSSVRVAQYFI